MKRIRMENVNPQTGEIHAGTWVGWSCPYYDVPTQNPDAKPHKYQSDARRVTEPLCLMVGAIDERINEDDDGVVSFNIIPREYGDEASIVIEDDDGNLWAGTPTRVVVHLK